MMMRPLTLAAALCLLAFPASADWNGLYLGGSGTLAPGEVVSDFDSYGLSGGLFGAQAGYRLEAGSVVIGAEADYLWGETLYETDDSTISIDQLGAGRLTLGVPFGPILPYGAAGIALGHIAGAENGQSLDDYHLGFSVGGGVEAALTDFISLRAEYQYIRLGEGAFEVWDAEAPHADVHALKAGVNFNF